MATAETITNARIRELRASVQSPYLRDCCDAAIHHADRETHENARARCAEIIDARTSREGK